MCCLLPLVTSSSVRPSSQLSLRGPFSLPSWLPWLLFSLVRFEHRDCNQQTAVNERYRDREKECQEKNEHLCMKTRESESQESQMRIMSALARRKKFSEVAWASVFTIRRAEHEASNGVVPSMRDHTRAQA